MTESPAIVVVSATRAEQAGRVDAARRADDRRARHQAAGAGAEHARRRRQRRHGPAARARCPRTSRCRPSKDAEAAASVAAGTRGDAGRRRRRARRRAATPARASPTRPAGAPPRTRCSRRCFAPTSASSRAGSTSRSRCASRGDVLVATPITPNQITLFAAALGVLGCALIASGRYAVMVPASPASSSSRCSTAATASWRACACSSRSSAPGSTPSSTTC